MEFPIEAGFLGPKAEHSKTWSDIFNYILQDYIHWRKNYFPEDEQVLDRGTRRSHEPWFDILSNNLDKVLNQLKADYPFYSPRYQGHMVTENLVSGVVGYFAGMLYNPNNVSSESAPITVNLELEAGRMIAEMLGYDPAQSWSHITSGGTIANMEALWAARQNQLNGVAFQEVCSKYDIRFIIWLPNGEHQDIRQVSQYTLMNLQPAIQVQLPALFEQQVAGQEGLPLISVLMKEAKYGKYSVTHNGIHAVYQELGIEPVILASQAAHYSIAKIANILGLGEKNVILLPVDQHFRVDMAALRAIVADLKENQIITSLIGILGTTQEGAIDPIHEMVAFRRELELLQNRSFWFHVDAAWGGYLGSLDLDSTILSKHAIAAVKGAGEADSITIDPHKMGYIPYPAGVINFKSKYAVLHSHQVAPYITLNHETPNPLEVDDLKESIGPYIIEGSKPGAAAVATWLTHKTVPLKPEGHGKLVKASIENTSRFYDLIQKSNADGPVTLKAISRPDCNVLCYYFSVEGNNSLTFQNKLNQRIFRAFSLKNSNGKQQMPYRQEYFVSHTHFFPSHYPFESVGHLVEDFDDSQQQYEENGLFLLRSVIINPWLDASREKEMDYLQDLIHKLYEVANQECQVHGLEQTDAL